MIVELLVYHFPLKPVILFCLFGFLFVSFFFKTESHYVILAGLMLSRSVRLVLNSQRTVCLCLCLMSAGIKSVHYHTWQVCDSFLFVLRCILFLFICLCTCLWVPKEARKVLEHLELESQAVVICLMWILREP